VIEAAPKKPHKNEDGTGGRSPQDPDADWTKKGGKYHFGYKAHVGIDQGSELVRKISMTPAHVHDGNMLEPALSGDEDWAFADKAYDSKKNSKILEDKGIGNGILIKGTHLTQNLKKSLDATRLLEVKSFVQHLWKIR
jgi:IS5 family transposase